MYQESKYYKNKSLEKEFLVEDDKGVCMMCSYCDAVYWKKKELSKMFVHYCQI